MGRSKAFGPESYKDGGQNPGIKSKRTGGHGRMSIITVLVGLVMVEKNSLCIKILRALALNLIEVLCK